MPNPGSCRGCIGGLCDAIGIEDRMDQENRALIASTFRKLVKQANAFGDEVLEVVYRSTTVDWLPEFPRVMDLRDIVKKVEVTVESHDYLGCRDHSGEAHRKMKAEIQSTLLEANRLIQVLERIESKCLPAN